jgi:hypothetical protein
VSRWRGHRLPVQYQPRDWRMHLPSSHTMNLHRLHSYQRTINASSALYFASSSDLWSLHYYGHLCACASSLPSIIHTMALLDGFFSSFSFHLSHPAVCTPPRCSPATLAISLCLLTFFLLQPCLECGGNPSGARLGTKTGSAWSFSLKLAHTPSHNSSPSSPSSSGQSSQSQSGLPPLSSPWDYRVEWLDLLGNSLGFSLGPLSDLSSSSQPSLVVPPNSPENSAPAPPPVHSPPVQVSKGGHLCPPGETSGPAPVLLGLCHLCKVPR